MQIQSLFVQFVTNTMPLAHGRSNDEASERHRQHKGDQVDCGNGIRIKDTQGKQDPKIKQENSARNTANALAHSDPNNRKKTQIIEAELRQRRTEHYPEDQQNSDDLGYHFDRFANSHLAKRFPSLSKPLLWRKVEELPSYPRKCMDQKKRTTPTRAIASPLYQLNADNQNWPLVMEWSASNPAIPAAVEKTAATSVTSA